MIANVQELGRHKDKTISGSRNTATRGAVNRPYRSHRPVTVLVLAPRAAGTGTIPLNSLRGGEDLPLRRGAAAQGTAPFGGSSLGAELPRQSIM